MIQSDRIGSSDSIQIKQTEDHGKVLVSTKSLDPSGPLGLTVFRETALLSIPNRGSSMDQSGPVPDYLARGPQMWTDWWAFQQQPEAIRVRVLKMYKETDCPHAVAIRQYLTHVSKKKEEEERQSEDTKHDADHEGDVEFSRRYDILQNIEEFIKLAMVIKFNAVELCPPSDDGSGPGTDFGYGLFEVACKMSHSCQPNCIWMTEPDGISKQIRAISKIQEGEELTVDYVGQSLSPTHERREELLESKGFLCKCARCANHQGDDTRRFPCICHATIQCSGVHLVHQPLASISPRLLPCSVCNAVATDDYSNRMLEEESKLRKRVENIKQFTDKDEEGYQILSMAKEIKQLNPPHRCHSLAENCYRLKADLYIMIGEYKLAAEACSKQIGCRVGILGEDYLSQSTAFCCERLGDVLRHVNVEEAEEAYKRSVRDLLVMRGGVPDPYSKCAVTKLLKVQSVRMRTSEDHLPRDQGLEGIVDAQYSHSAVQHPCALCGSGCEVAGLEEEGLLYCSEEHQRMHLNMMSSG